MCLPNNLFLTTLKTSRQRKRKTGNFCDRNMFVIRTAKGNVGLVSVPQISYVDIGLKTNKQFNY